ncbi:hypothetical protein [Paraburkholderia tropica]|uniref:Uncharacterized protein n=1 Tax=Paraburkholderia tropica TaxID=92647 RepID=A0ABX5MHL4_9BURK|nr:hypothetical protein [Paraburkholderia tropica]PXX05630.1 hypothetical protein C7400_1403 [Paraburkholderia tropica]PZW70752.1 hypothetical protein C7399_1403 [Paraburkholderia tropica]QNB17280.1 hypothetical protein G5S35_37255 [Paraburkholderia tropica]
MDDETGEEVAAIAGKLLQQAIELGLAWDEAVAAFGLAAKAAALAAANAGADPGGDCVSIARQQLMAAFELDVRVIVATNLPDRAEAEADDNPLLATALRRHGSKLH